MSVPYNLRFACFSCFVPDRQQFKIYKCLCFLFYICWAAIYNMKLAIACFPYFVPARQQLRINILPVLHVLSLLGNNLQPLQLHCFLCKRIREEDSFYRIIFNFSPSFFQPLWYKLNIKFLNIMFPPL